MVQMIITIILLKIIIVISYHYWCDLINYSEFNLWRQSKTLDKKCVLLREKLWLGDFSWHLANPNMKEVYFIYIYIYIDILDIKGFYYLKLHFSIVFFCQLYCMLIQYFHS